MTPWRVLAWVGLFLAAVLALAQQEVFAGVVLIVALIFFGADYAVTNEKKRETEKTAESTRLCPYCAEPIAAAAIKCKHCQSDLPKDARGAGA